MIDFRTSFRSHAFFEALARRSEPHVSAEQGVARLSGDALLPPVELEEHVSQWVAELAAHGVEHAGAVAGSHEEIANLAEAADVARGVLAPLAPIDPTSPDALALVERWVGSGAFRGIVLSPSSDGYRLSDGAATDVLELLASSAGVCLVECGIPGRALHKAFGFRPAFDPVAANPLELLTVAERYPDVAFVVPSFGAGLFRELLLLASLVENVYADTGSWNRWRAAQPESLGLVDVFERALGVLGPERLLFATGSGAPNRGWRHPILTHQREAVGACGLTNPERDLVFDGNARRLLSLAVPARRHQPSTAL